MKLEDILLKSFFYPFLIAILLNSLIILIILILFSNSNYDKRTIQNIVNLEKKYSQVNVKSANTIITLILSKIQTSLNEQILLYQRIANKLKHIDINRLNLHEDLFKCVFDFDQNFYENNKDYLEHIGYWYINDKIKKFEDINNNKTKKQIISFSNIMQNLYSAYSSSSKSYSNLDYFFYFEETDLYISFPVLYDYMNDMLDSFKEFDNPYWCTNDEGEVYTIYNMKCRDFYINIKKAETSIFDNNYLSNKTRTIFLTNFYKQLNNENAINVFSLCIKFLDPITNSSAYACSDINQEDMIFAFDELNSNLNGYFFISSIGFNKVFFFPNENDYSKTITDNIYKRDIKYLLKEKVNFVNNIQKSLSSNYKEQLRNDLYGEIYINGNNSNQQYFFVNEEKLLYVILPVILENLSGEKEHILSIIYIYNEDRYLSKLMYFSYSLIIKIILELLLLIIIGLCLIYLIISSFNILSKYIVIPIKNSTYMIKGINIGGHDRINYLAYLKKKYDDNFEKLEKMYMSNTKENDNNILNEEILIKDKEYNTTNEKESLNINNNNKEMKNNNNNYNKIYEEESNLIDKEINFYDLDEGLLQYRPLEIENLIKMILNIKKAFTLTSSDHNVENIIHYSHSEEIFKNFKNNKGLSICQSNIGNLQIQLLKFDKAIYHLAYSLQEDKLQKFLNNNLSEALDENNILLNKIHYFFNSEKTKEKNNVLIKKQKRNKNIIYSQKIIGDLINNRYSKLIYSYYKFFKGLKKLHKLKDNNTEKIKEQFMNSYFHNINYYHKIIIQYIYLSFIKNDLIKIGESILDYIEFLITFKLKTHKDKKHILKINNKKIEQLRDKSNMKKKIFDKIINCFNLFDDYITYVKDNTSLDDYKNIIKYNSNSTNQGYNSSVNKSFSLFRVNLQRSIFLKGKFALICKNYNDALFYFIRSAKKKSIVLDGLIKKRSLKHIYKLLIKMEKKYIKYGIFNSNFNQKHHKLNISKGNKIFKNKEDNYINDIKNKISHEEIKIIKRSVINDISKCNAKQNKDIIILIDFNIYSKTEKKEINIDKINLFINQANSILKNYLSKNDRLAVFIYIKQYYIICPLLHKNQIDIKNFSNDLNYFKSKIFENNDDEHEYNINLSVDLELEGENLKENSEDEEELFENDNNNKIELINYNIDKLAETINYIQNYFKKKEDIKNEKYLILFTDLFNADLLNDKKYIEKFFDRIKNNKNTIFLLVGKNKENNENNLSSIEFTSDKFILNFVCDNFSKKSKLIYLESMSEIKNILSYNNVIVNEIIFPNEIYK